MREARIHLEFTCLVCRLQMTNNSYYLFEHPLTATSWQEPCIQRLLVLPGTFRITAHQCQHGMALPDPNNNGIVTPVLKPTAYMTNSPAMAQQLERHCDGSHQHVKLEGKLTRLAAIYPPKLCANIIAGHQKQKLVDQQGCMPISSITGYQCWDDASGK